MVLLFLIAAAALGLIIGSFLNVVIFRLPRAMSIAQPRSSFCPACERSIRWFDNVPVLSWLALRGRCRNCGQPISLQYPLVELLTAMVFVAVYDAVVIARIVPGADSAATAAVTCVGLWALFAALMSNAVIDLELYQIDVRLTSFAMIVGVAAHGARGAVASGAAMPDWRLGLAALAAGLVWLATSWFQRSRVPADAAPPDDAGATEHAASAQTPGEPDADASKDGPADTAQQLSWPAAASAVILLGVALSVLTTAAGASIGAAAAPAAFATRAIVTLAVLSFVLILSAMQNRLADEEMLDLLEAERPLARPTAARELAWLLPTIAAAAAVWALWPRMGAARPFIAATWDWKLLSGLAEGLTGLMGGAALGWGVRIFFTLLFGKEAYGTGDIYLMAAIGAAAGFPVCVIAFFAACILALFGVLAAMFRKNCRAIPFGPWLALGTLVALWTQEAIIRFMSPALPALRSALGG